MSAYFGAKNCFPHWGNYSCQRDRRPVDFLEGRSYLGLKVYNDCSHLANCRGMRMIDRNWAEVFAREWVDAWNAHDLERIFSHYTDDFEMTSPLIVERMGVASGRLKGKEAIRRYWGQGLAGAPNLRFELLQVMVGVNSLAIDYKSVTAGRTVIERIEFDDHGQAVQAEALYGPLEAGKVVGEDEYN